jgi:hypothetical protein
MMNLFSAKALDEYIKELGLLLDKAKSRSELYELIVNAPFNNPFNSTLLGLGFLAFLQVNQEEGNLDRISISDTYTAQGAINMTNKEFHDMKVPLKHKGNIVLIAIQSGKPQITNDWHLLTDPAVTAEESRINQAAAGISSSLVYPTIKTEPRSAIIFQYYIPLSKIGRSQHDFMERYIKLVSKSLNSLNH